MRTSAMGIHQFKIQQQRRQQEAEEQRRIDEYNRRLAAMTPEQRAEFLRKKREREAAVNGAVAVGVICLLTGCGSGSSQVEETESEKASREFHTEGRLKSGGLR